MSSETGRYIEHCAALPAPLRLLSLAMEPGRLSLVTEHEEEELRRALTHEQVPPDFEAKLIKLLAGSLLHRSVEQNCRLFIALLQASYQGCFAEALPEERRRLLRVLAYVRKDDDAIPDYKTDGFKDDQQEVRAAATELSGLLYKFKAWRLRYQVPRVWNGARLMETN